MKTTSMKSAILLVLGGALAGCPAASCNETSDETSEGDGSEGASGASSTKATAEPAGSGSSAPSSVKTAPRALAKAELDGKKPDAAHTGQTLAVSSAKMSFVVQRDWKKDAAAEVERAVGSASRFAATGEAGDVLAALELTDCTWADEEDIVLGVDELATKVSDGVCMQGKATYRTIRAKIDVGGKEVLAVGGWKDGSDSDDVLDAFRSAAKTRSVQACCSALTNNAVHAPANQKLIYAAAAGFCQTLVNTKEGRDALRQIRGKLPGVSIPASCM